MLLQQILFEDVEHLLQLTENESAMLRDNGLGFRIGGGGADAAVQK